MIIRIVITKIITIMITITKIITIMIRIVSTWHRSGDKCTFRCGPVPPLAVDASQRSRAGEECILKTFTMHLCWRRFPFFTCANCPLTRAQESDVKSTEFRRIPGENVVERAEEGGERPLVRKLHRSRGWCGGSLEL